mmetsp:Transcript_53068/g.164855  ORF Transcript_53068/g.164855 Transcript_53068/m.164855 type:complete len:296 (+) Transcript_53068:657-1544(+)
MDVLEEGRDLHVHTGPRGRLGLPVLCRLLLRAGLQSGLAGSGVEQRCRRSRGSARGEPPAELRDLERADPRRGHRHRQGQGYPVAAGHHGHPQLRDLGGREDDHEHVHRRGVHQPGVAGAHRTAPADRHARGRPRLSLRHDLVGHQHAASWPHGEGFSDPPEHQHQVQCDEGASAHRPGAVGGPPGGNDRPRWEQDPEGNEADILPQPCEMVVHHEPGKAPALFPPLFRVPHRRYLERLDLEAHQEQERCNRRGGPRGPSQDAAASRELRRRVRRGGGQARDVCRHACEHACVRL